MNSLATGAQNQHCWSTTWATPAGHSTRAKSILHQEIPSLWPGIVLSALCALLSQVLITRIPWTSWVPEFTQLKGRVGPGSQSGLEAGTLYSTKGHSKGSFPLKFRHSLKKSWVPALGWLSWAWGKSGEWDLKYPPWWSWYYCGDRISNSIKCYKDRWL